MNNNAAVYSQTLALNIPLPLEKRKEYDEALKFIEQSLSRPLGIPVIMWETQDSPQLASQDAASEFAKRTIMPSAAQMEQKALIGEEKKALMNTAKVSGLVRFSTFFLWRYGRKLQTEVADTLVLYSQGVPASDYGRTCTVLASPEEMEAAECTLSFKMNAWWANHYEFRVEIPAVVNYAPKTQAWEEEDTGLPILSRTANIYVGLCCSMDEKFDFFIDVIGDGRDYGCNDELNRKQGLIKLDENLIPILTQDELDEEVMKLWQRYYPEALNDKKELDPYVLAEKMGLTIKKCYLSGHKGKYAMLFWKPAKVNVKDYTIAASDKSNQETTIYVDADTIVLNMEGTKYQQQRIAVFHECLHHEFHWLFFSLQELYSADLRRIKFAKEQCGTTKKSKKKANGDATQNAANREMSNRCIGEWVGKEIDTEEDEIDEDDLRKNDPKKPLRMLEWQARNGALALAMPKEIIEPVIAKKRAEINSDHEGKIWQDIIFYLAKEFNVGNYQAKKRVIDIGHWQARGAANYIVTKKAAGKSFGHYICPFMFEKENCPSSAYTYVITPEQAYKLYMENASYRKLIASGEFVYADGHVCIASPEYVEQGIKGPQLTDWANRHVDECCLRFKNIYQANEEYGFSLIYICSDEEYNKHYCEFVTRGKKMSMRAANELASKISEEMPRRAGKAVAYLLAVDGKVRGKKPLSLERFAECCGVSRATAYRWCDEDCQLKPEEFMRIVIGLHLPPNISMQLMTTCGIVLNHYGVQEMYWFILLTRFMDSIYDVNDFLESEGFPTFKIATA